MTVPATEMSLAARIDLAGELYWRGEYDAAHRILTESPAPADAPRFAALVHNLVGMVQMRRGQYDDAERQYREAAHLFPTWDAPRANLGYALLARGELREGFRWSEWRLADPRYFGRRQPPSTPRWDGKPMAGETLLVVAEAGIGDQILAARLLPSLAASADARVVVEAHPSIAGLLRHSLVARQS